MGAVADEQHPVVERVLGAEEGARHAAHVGLQPTSVEGNCRDEGRAHALRGEDGSEKIQGWQ